MAALIDPTSVSFKSLTDPEGTTVLEQNFEYDLVGSTALLQKYIDKVIVVQTQDSQDLHRHPAERGRQRHPAG